MPTPSDPYYHNTVLHLPFDSDLRDKSWAGNNVVAFGNVAVSTAEKKHGAGSAAFDGAGDYVNMPDGERFVFGLSDFTFEGWVNTIAQGKVLVDKWSGASANSWQIWFSGPRIGLRVGNSTVIAGALNICDGAWHHFAIVRNNGVFSTFADGVLDNQVTATANMSAVASGGLSVGAQVHSRNPTYDYAGLVDDLRITKGVARYTENFTPPGAIEYFNWDDPESVTPSTAESYTFAPYAPSRPVHLPTVAPGPMSGIRGGTEYGGRGRIVGTVKNKGELSDTPVYRRVRLFKDRDGQCVAETWSDPVTGAYAFENINPAHKYTALSYDHTGQFRAVVADNLTPEVF